MSSAKNFMPHYVGKQKTSAESVALSSGEQTSADSASSKGDYHLSHQVVNRHGQVETDT